MCVCVCGIIIKLCFVRFNKTVLQGYSKTLFFYWEEGGGGGVGFVGWGLIKTKALEAYLSLAFHHYYHVYKHR